MTSTGLFENFKKSSWMVVVSRGIIHSLDSGTSKYTTTTKKHATKTKHQNGTTNNPWYCRKQTRRRTHSKPGRLPSSCTQTFPSVHVWIMWTPFNKVNSRSWRSGWCFKGWTVPNNKSLFGGYRQFEVDTTVHQTIFKLLYIRNLIKITIKYGDLLLMTPIIINWLSIILCLIFFGFPVIRHLW